jgi:hypothetical protein
MSDRRDDLDALIKRFQSRPRYHVLDEDIIASISDKELEQAIVDHVRDVKVRRDSEHAVDVFSSLSAGFRMVYATRVLQDEVNNGGFNQFFWNGSGNLAAHARDGFRLFGAHALAALVEKAIAIFHREEAVQRKFKEKRTLEAFHEWYKHTRIGKLDKEFYALARSLSQARISYVRSHPREFVSGPGK